MGMTLELLFSMTWYWIWQYVEKGNFPWQLPFI